MKKKKRSDIINVLLFILPFLIFIIINFISDSSKNAWEYWYLKNKIIAFLFLFVTLIMFLFKYNKEKWFYIWAGFSLYFSSCFVVDDLIGFSKMIKLFNYSPTIISDVGTHISNYFIPDFFLVTNIILFIILLEKFNVKLEKIFYLVFIYYFIYCYFLFEQYQLYLSLIYMDSKSVLKITKLNILLNSLISIIFFIYLNFLKKNHKNKKIFMIFLFMNFLIISISQIKLIFSINFFILFWSYIKYFLIYSKLVYFIIFIIIYNFFFVHQQKSD